MKRLIFILLIFLVNSSFAQEITFSDQIANSTDKNIIAIREQWKSYWADCIKAYIAKDEQILNKYWDNKDVQNQYNSIMLHQLSDKVPISFFGEMVTYEITKLYNEFYRIKAMVLMSDSITKGVAANFTIYAMLKNNKVKFCSYFQKQKESLENYSTASINYYYPPNFLFDINNAQKAEKMFCKLLHDFDIEKDKKITYIVANNLESANRLIGFDYTIHSSTSKDAGYYIKSSNVLVSCQIAHLHELVHVVLQSKYPNAPQLFHEGIATYLGGTNGEKFKFHLKMLKEITNNKVDIDFSNFNEWNKIIDNKTNPFYTIGAILIDHAYKIGGQEKVETLFNSTEEVNETLKNELQIENIDSFIKDYLTKIYKN